MIDVANPLVTIVEPGSLAPAGRLGAWLEGAGARVRTVRLWSGDPVPALGDLGGAMLLMGGVTSAHSDADHPWLPGVPALLRHAVDADLPVLGVCLGAQVAAEALGGRTAVPSPEGSEDGVVELLLRARPPATRSWAPPSGRGSRPPRRCLRERAVAGRPRETPSRPGKAGGRCTSAARRRPQDRLPRPQRTPS